MVVRENKNLKQRAASFRGRSSPWSKLYSDHSLSFPRVPEHPRNIKIKGKQATAPESTSQMPRPMQLNTHKTNVQKKTQYFKVNHRPWPEELLAERKSQSSRKYSTFTFIPVLDGN